MMFEAFCTVVFTSTPVFSLYLFDLTVALSRRAPPLRNVMVVSMTPIRRRWTMVVDRRLRPAWTLFVLFQSGERAFVGCEEEAAPKDTYSRTELSRIESRFEKLTSSQERSSDHIGL